jgi:D-beta-D-heptose 7-phosphate kinase/D-beta-D-heptose 1-phosphate adenosyltransferase
MKRKIISRKQVRALADGLRSAGKRIAFTNGCFDILHRGHLCTFAEARKHGDILMVGVNSDGSVRRLKGAGRPIMDEAARSELVAALEMVDYVVVFGEDTPRELIEEIQPDVIVKGADYRADVVVGRETVEARGGAVVLVPIVEGYSTTALIEKACRDGRK